MSTEGLSISDVASRSGVPASTLRYYEDIKLLSAPPRISGRRRYDESVLDRLVVITTARHAGFTLAEVRDLLDSMATGTTPSGWAAMAARKLPEVDALIKRLGTVRLLLEGVAACQCRDLAQCATLLRGCDGGQDGSWPGPEPSGRAEAGVGRGA